jgi:hypothetical protein
VGHFVDVESGYRSNGSMTLVDQPAAMACILLDFYLMPPQPPGPATGKGKSSPPRSQRIACYPSLKNSDDLHGLQRFRCFLLPEIEMAERVVETPTTPLTSRRTTIVACSDTQRLHPRACQQVSPSIICQSYAKHHILRQVKSYSVFLDFQLRPTRSTDPGRMHICV